LACSLTPAHGKRSGRALQGGDRPGSHEGQKGRRNLRRRRAPMDTTLEKMLQMSPHSSRTDVTAGNASGINDAAAAVLMMSATRQKSWASSRSLKSKPLRRRAGPGVHGARPRAGSAKSSETGRHVHQGPGHDRAERGLRFQAIGCFRELGIDTEKANQLGSGISLGHPIGCTGAA